MWGNNYEIIEKRPWTHYISSTLYGVLLSFHLSFNSHTSVYEFSRWHTIDHSLWPSVINDIQLNIINTLFWTEWHNKQHDINTARSNAKQKPTIFSHFPKITTLLNHFLLTFKQVMIKRKLFKHLWLQTVCQVSKGAFIIADKKKAFLVNAIYNVYLFLGDYKALNKGQVHACLQVSSFSLSLSLIKSLPSCILFTSFSVTFCFQSSYLTRSLLSLRSSPFVHPQDSTEQIKWALGEACYVT